MRSNRNGRGELRDEMNMCKSEMDITYQEVAQINEQLNSLFSRRRDLDRSIRWVDNRISRAGHDREEAHDYSVQNFSNYEELRILDSEINQLRANKGQLWEQHKAARDRYNLARDRYRSSVDQCRAPSGLADGGRRA
jgi:chromosome segregation ATPase